MMCGSIAALRTNPTLALSFREFPSRGQPLSCVWVYFRCSPDAANVVERANLPRDKNRVADTGPSVSARLHFTPVPDQVLETHLRSVEGCLRECPWSEAELRVDLLTL